MSTAGIIAEDKNGPHFIEVRAQMHTENGFPIDSVDMCSCERFGLVAETYLVVCSELPDMKGDARHHRHPDYPRAQGASSNGSQNPRDQLSGGIDLHRFLGGRYPEGCRPF